MRRLARESIRTAAARAAEAGLPLDIILADFERAFLTQVLEDNRWNACRSADLLGIHRNTIARRMGDLDIVRPPRVRKLWPPAGKRKLPSPSLLCEPAE